LKQIDANQTTLRKISRLHQKVIIFFLTAPFSDLFSVFQEEASDWPIVFYASSGLSMLAGVSISIFGSFHVPSPPMTSEPEPVVALGSTIDMLSSRDSNTHVTTVDGYATGPSSTYSFPPPADHRGSTGSTREPDRQAVVGGAQTGSSVVSVV
jgi:hypothetical protein